MQSKWKVTSNLQHTCGVVKIFHGKQFDANTRYIEATIMDGDSAFTMPSNPKFMVGIRQADGTEMVYDAIITATPTLGLVVTVDTATYMSHGAINSTFTFDGTNWKRSGTVVDLSAWGITIVSGTPSNGNTIVIATTSAVTYSSNVVTFAVHPNLFLTAGDGCAELYICDGDEIISTFVYTVRVEKAAANPNNAVASTSFAVITAQIESYVNAWLTAHPEATTTVRDGSITTPKLADESVTLDKLAADTIAEIDNKADIDGSYESMTVGNAEQLVSSVGIEDSTPYNFRTSGGSTEIGDREELNAMVGVSVPWNQLVPTANRDFTSESSDTRALFFVLRKSSSPYTTLYQKQNVAVGILSSVVASSFDGYAEMTHSGSQRNIRITPVNGFRLTNGHKYLFSLNFTSVDTSTVGGVVAKDISVFDLTLALGSTIADYIYALEQSNAGSGVAYFRKLFPKLFYEYNAGELLSVKTSAHKMVGFNQWDEEWELGSINVNTGEDAVSTNTIRSKNYMRVVPNTTYYNKAPMNLNTVAYDANKQYLRRVYPIVNSTYTIPEDVHYLRFYYGTSATPVTTYNHDVCWNIHWDGERDGEYEPYQQWNYPLDSSLTLRGILKLDANNKLYADGDRYMPSGEVQRRYKEETFDGSNDESWTLNTTSEGNAIFQITISDSVSIVNDNNDLRTRCDKLTAYPAYPLTRSGRPTYACGLVSSNRLFVILPSASVADVTALRTWLGTNNLKVVYELATPTTETASPYQQTQIVDDFGTEEFVDAAVEANERDVAIPVGHETFYQNNLKAKLEMAPNSPDGDGVYVVQQTNGENEYVPLVEVKELPDMPSEDGLYKLRCTVTNGTETLSWVSDS